MFERSHQNREVQVAAGMTLLVACMVTLLFGTGNQVAAQPRPEASALILDANGNQAALGKK